MYAKLYFRFRAAYSPSSVQIARKRRVARYRSIDMLVVRFSWHIDILSSDHLRCRSLRPGFLFCSGFFPVTPDRPSSCVIEFSMREKLSKGTVTKLVMFLLPQPTISRFNTTSHESRVRNSF